MHQVPESTGPLATGLNATPLRTPARDLMHINEDGVLPLGATPKPQQVQVRQELRAKLGALPKPKNEFEVVMPDEDEDDFKEDSGPSRPEDAADIAARKQAAAEAAERLRLSLRPQVIQRDLPRPTVINAAMAAAVRGDEDSQFEEADQLIKAELVAMLAHDAVAHPIRGAAVRPGAPPALEEFSQAELGEAKTLLLEEVLEVAAEPVPLDVFTRIHAEVSADFMFLPSQRKYGKVSAATKSEKIAALNNELEVHRSNMIKQTKKASKVASKLDVLLGGHHNRFVALNKQVSDLVKQIEQSSLDLESFHGLAQIERAGIENRVQELQGAVTAQLERETALQTKYAELSLQQTQRVHV